MMLMGREVDAECVRPSFGCGRIWGLVDAPYRLKIGFSLLMWKPLASWASSISSKLPLGEPAAMAAAPPPPPPPPPPRLASAASMPGNQRPRNLPSQNGKTSPLGPNFSVSLPRIEILLFLKVLSPLNLSPRLGGPPRLQPEF